MGTQGTSLRYGLGGGREWWSAVVRVRLAVALKGASLKPRLRMAKPAFAGWEIVVLASGGQLAEVVIVVTQIARPAQVVIVVTGG